MEKTETNKTLKTISCCELISYIMPYSDADKLANDKNSDKIMITYEYLLEKLGEKEKLCWNCATKHYAPFQIAKREMKKHESRFERLFKKNDKN
ncbi:protein of unknown function [endosymbiont DhMRE of Dentiscutata heterogama]|uniref:hypothetical protein n=1 Tax=endosymbiont DhMRE of Dentiscutata heterogama TaxID=1609546 RepID=UPI000629DCD3|nr:hypothetical protein [endosymbiont DhMRE of Dentiscutata heterogama]CFW92983.1 protein of unknown function [endosymbiont DhMRE of Dentiscutata heterogama]